MPPAPVTQKDAFSHPMWTARSHMARHILAGATPEQILQAAGITPGTPVTWAQVYPALAAHFDARDKGGKTHDHDRNRRTVPGAD